jgi:Leucine-rich repeat (LRR) protein/energy-coupling factor transporter ATP-binding protein EcfA2
MSQLTPTPLPRLWDDLSLRPYLGEIRRRYGIVEILALPSMRDLPPLRIETLFVQPLLAEVPVSADSDPKQWPQGQNLFTALEQNSRLVVLGDPGSGKTTLANWLAWRLSAGLTAPLPKVLEDRVPLPCVLREMKAALFAATTTLPELAESVARRLLGDKAGATLLTSLRERVAAGSYVLILDGVDEIPVSHRKTVAGWVRQAAAQQACVLATSRIVGYEDGPVDREEIVLREDHDSRKELLDKLGRMAANEFRERFVRMADHMLKTNIEAMEEKPVWAQRRYLMPFDSDRVTAFTENWYCQRCGTEHEAREKTADLLAALNRSEVTQRLARTPNLLALMAIVHRERAHLPDGKALLYDEIANAYIHTIDSQRKIEPGDALAPFGWKERKAWLARVGFEMQQRRSTKTKKEDGEAGVLSREVDVLAWLTNAMPASSVAQPEQTAGAFLGWVARRSGLLLPRGEGYYAFVHLSFQEYFCACFLADRIVSPAFVKKGKSNDGLINRDLLRQWGGESVWRETLVFLFELLSTEHDADWMDDLVDTLFEPKQNINFKENHAVLAARALVDQHIRLRQDRQNQLADLCSVLVIRRGYTASLALTDVLFALLEVGWAAKLTALRELDLSGTGALDLRRLAELSALQKLNLNKTRVSNLEPLSRLSALQKLNLDGTRVSDLEPLVGLSALQELSLDGTRVSDLEPLVGLSALQELSLWRTKVSDLRPLAGLTALRWLDLGGTQVSDLTPLAGLTALRWLELGGTKVSDLGPLAGLTALQVLDLSGTGVTDVSPLAGLPNLEIFIDGRTIRSAALKKN